MSSVTGKYGGKGQVLSDSHLWSHLRIRSLVGLSAYPWRGSHTWELISNRWSSECGSPRSRHVLMISINICIGKYMAQIKCIKVVYILHIRALCCRTFCEWRTIYLGPRVSSGKSETTLAQNTCLFQSLLWSCHYQTKTPFKNTFPIVEDLLSNSNSTTTTNSNNNNNNVNSYPFPPEKRQWVQRLTDSKSATHLRSNSAPAE